MRASNVIIDCVIILLFTCITTVILLIREHELMSHETDSGIAGLFFNIYSFKLAKDQINTLTVKTHAVFITNKSGESSFLN